MKKINKLMMTAAALSTALFVNVTPAYAAAEYYNPEITYGSTHYYKVSDVNDWTTIAHETTAATPAISYTAYPVVWSFGSGASYLTDDAAATMRSVKDQSDAWLAASMPSIVPSGMDRNTAMSTIASWIADRMTYRHTANDQTALPCFANGQGVCTTYATAFDAMVHYLPFTGNTVDWANGTDHLTVSPVYSATHCWSAVLLDGSWVYFDVCWYDCTLKDSRWLWSADPTFHQEKDHIVTVF